MLQKRCVKCGALFDETAETCNRCKISVEAFDSTTVIPEKLPNILKAYVSFFKNWNNFNSRSIRLEYWLTFLANLLAIACVAILSAIVSSVVSSLFVVNVGSAVGYSVLGYLAIILFPSFSLTVRRFHDLSLSCWALLVGIIPIIGWLFVISSATRPSSNRDNKFGKNPYLGRIVPTSTYNGFFGKILDVIFFYS